VVRGEEV